MAKNTNIEYEFQNGRSICIINYKGWSFIGEAMCHPEDKDMESERIGLTIAENRANIRVLKFIKDFEIAPQVKILKHLYSNIKNSKKYNEKSYEVNLIANQIKHLEKETDEIKKEIADIKNFIKTYIDGKDKLYKKLRAKNQ